MSVPCSNCGCGNCEIFSDDFSVDNLATDWDDRSGSWAVSGGDLDCTSASALIVTTADVTAGLNGVFAAVKITCATTSDIGRLVIAYVDDNNYWFAEVQPGASNGTLKLFQRSSGVNTQKGDTQTIAGFQATEQLQLVICYSSGVVVTTAGTNLATVSTSSSITIAGTQCGLGTGAGSSSVSFDDFSFTQHDVDNATCAFCDRACNPCSDGLPATIEVTLPSNLYDSENNPINCVTTACCLTQNGQTVVLALDPTATFLSGVCQKPDVSRNCFWNYTAPSPFCPDQGCAQTWSLRVYAWFDTTGTTLRVVVGNGPGGLETAHLFAVAVSNPFACAGVELELPYVNAMPGCTTGDGCISSVTPNDLVVVL
jgi:hypothetical protein